MDERLKFLTRMLDGEKTDVLCREFETSHNPGLMAPCFTDHFKTAHVSLTRTQIAT